MILLSNLQNEQELTTSRYRYEVLKLSSLFEMHQVEANLMHYMDCLRVSLNLQCPYKTS